MKQWIAKIIRDCLTSLIGDGISRAVDDRIFLYVEHLETQLTDVNKRLVDCEKRHMLEEIRSSTLTDRVAELEREIRYLKGEEHGA